MRSPSNSIAGTKVPPRANFNIGRREGAQGFGGNGGPPGGGGGNDNFVNVVGYEKNTAGEKVANSLSGLFLGPVVIFFACMLLWHNESWAIKTHRSLNEALDAHVEIENAKLPPDGYNYNRLVHVAGTVTVDAPITDHQFDLTRSNAIALTRHVEIYQWVEKVTEERRKLQNGDTEVREIINYRKEWVSQPITHAFRRPSGHENVGDLPMAEETQRAYQVSLGVYVLGNVLTNQITNRREVPISAIKTLPEGATISGNRIDWPIRVRGGGGLLDENSRAVLTNGVEERVMRFDGNEKKMYVVKATGDSFSSKERALEAVTKEHEIARRTTTASSQPEIGDVRIHFTEVPCTFVSVLAQLSPSGGNMLTNWPSKQGDGYDVALLTQGAVTARDMIESEQAANTIRTWWFRGGGLLLNVIGFSMITSIVSATADITLNWIPLLGPMSTSLINLSLAVANTVMASSLTLLITSIAWVFYRPMLGIAMLAGSLGLFFSASKAGNAAQGSAMGMKFQKSS